MRVLSYLTLIFVLFSLTGCSNFIDHKSKQDFIRVMKADKADTYEVYIFGEFDSRVRFGNDLDVVFMVNRHSDPFSTGHDILKRLDLNLNYPAILIFDDQGLVLATEKPKEAINFIKRRE